MNPDRISSAEARLRGYDRDVIAQLELDEAAHAEAQLLIPEIRAAFASVPRPRVTLNVARGYDDEWQLTEHRVHELRAMDPEQTWEEVTDEAIQCCQEYFTFADAEGWRFYLPAYLCHFLRRFPHSSWDAVYWACVRGEKMDRLNTEQRQCVDRFLTLCHKWTVR